MTPKKEQIRDAEPYSPSGEYGLALKDLSKARPHDDDPEYLIWMLKRSTAETLRTILQSALDTQKPAGDALTGDCGGGDLEPINCLEEAIALSASACYMEGVRAYYDTTWIEALVEASRRYLALTADNAERGE